MLQVKEVLQKAKKHLPAVLQNESHPYLQEKDLRDFCRIHGIVFQVPSTVGTSYSEYLDSLLTLNDAHCQFEIHQN